MTAIFRNELKTSQCTAFVDQFQEDSNSVISNRLYCGISDTTGNDLSADVLDPADMPSNTPGDQELAFWYDPVDGGTGEAIIGIQKIDEANISVVVPRLDWVTATAYTAGEYVVAENGVGVIDIFLCVVAGTSSTKPEYTAGLTVDNTYFDDGLASLITDGSLVWKYLCRLPTPMTDALADTSWVPVPYNKSITTDSGDGDVNNARPDAVQLLLAKHVMCKVELLADNGGVNLPDSGTYSKVALIKNPIQSDNTSLCTATSYLSATLSNDGANPYPSGDMIFLEHRGAVTRQPAQTEFVKVVLAL